MTVKKRNPKTWTRKELVKLDYMYSVMEMSIDTIAHHYNKTHRAIEIQLQRLHFMHETTGTQYNEWYRKD